MNNATRVPSPREVFNLPAVLSSLIVAGYVAAALRRGPLSFGDLKYAAPDDMPPAAILSAVIRGLSTGALETDADGRIELAAALAAPPVTSTWSSSRWSSSPPSKASPPSTPPPALRCALDLARTLRARRAGEV